MKKRYSKPITKRTNAGIAGFAMSVFVLGFGVLFSAIARADAPAAFDVAAVITAGASPGAAVAHATTNKTLVRIA